MLCVNLKGTCSGQSNVSPYNKFQNAHGKKDITKTGTETTKATTFTYAKKGKEEYLTFYCLATKQLTFLNKQLKST